MKLTNWISDDIFENSEGLLWICVVFLKWVVNSIFFAIFKKNTIIQIDLYCRIFSNLYQSYKNTVFECISFRSGPLFLTNAKYSAKVGIFTTNYIRLDSSNLSFLCFTKPITNKKNYFKFTKNDKFEESRTM